MYCMYVSSWSHVDVRYNFKLVMVWSGVLCVCVCVGMDVPWQANQLGGSTTHQGGR